MPTFSLVERASDDLLDIYLFGIRQFGIRQADLYLDSLENCFQLLAENPRMGRRAERVAPGLRRHEHKSHVIFYREQAAGVEIVAVLHERRLPRLDRG